MTLCAINFVKTIIYEIQKKKENRIGTVNATPKHTLCKKACSYVD